MSGARIDFGDWVAESYRATRPLPIPAAASLLNSAIGPRQGRDVVRLADVGCGIGRHLSALPSIAANFTCDGYDRSLAMLREIPRQIERDPRIQLVVGDCAKGLRSDRKYDVILLHWVTHISPAWSDIAQSCVKSLGECGRLAWFHEVGELYDLVNGDWRSLRCQTLQRFAEDVLAPAVDGYGAEDFCLRHGTRFGDDSLLIEFLSGCGLRVDEDEAPAAHWTTTVSAEWIWRRVLATRTFSNLQHLPSAVFEDIGRRALRFFERYPTEARQRQEISFGAKTIIASREVSTVDCRSRAAVPC